MLFLVKYMNEFQSYLDKTLDMPFNEIKAIIH
jgi:hypothetical protein